MEDNAHRDSDGGGEEEGEDLEGIKNTRLNIGEKRRAAEYKRIPEGYRMMRQNFCSQKGPPMEKLLLDIPSLKHSPRYQGRAIHKDGETDENTKRHIGG